MSEYIIEWSGIGSDVTEMVQSHTPPWKVTKEIRHARLREPIMRCRDCEHYFESTVDDEGDGEPSWCTHWEHEWVRDDGFCAWGERVVDE